MSKWSSFYKDRCNDKYQQHVRNKYQPFISIIKNLIETNRFTNVAEFGCGIGTITKELQALPINFTLIDNDEEMLNLAQQHINNTKITYLNDCIKKESNQKYDLIYSHGVLEHFSDEEIQLIINKQKKLATYLIHYVPSYKYKNPSFGDERLMHPNEWQNICKPDKIISFNNGYDLILFWDKK